MLTHNQVRGILVVVIPFCVYMMYLLGITEMNNRDRYTLVNKCIVENKDILNPKEYCYAKISLETQNKLDK